MDAPAEASAAMRPAPIGVPGGDRRTADRELRRAYERFLTSRHMPPGVRRMVADSWQRCAASGMLPGNGRLPPLRMTSQALSEYRRTHPLAPLLPMFRDLLGAGAADDGHVFAIGDADGTLLWVEGDRQAMRRAERMRFVEGAVWSEAQAGTNAPGTVLAVGQPVQILSAEHYNCAVHAWSCAAAPVREPGTGRVLGVVDLTGGATIATPPALAAVRAAALAAEAQLAGRIIAATRLTAVTTPLPLSAAGVPTTAGTAPPAAVLVLGAGVAGLQAIATARRLGAIVSAYDVRPESRGEVESLGARFLDIQRPPDEESGAGQGGYARELTDQEQRDALDAYIARSDVVITTAQVPGRKPPLLVTATAVERMRPGSVVVDLAASALGGNVEGSEPEKTVVLDGGVTLIGAGRLSSAMATAASTAYSRNLVALLRHLLRDGELVLDPSDEITGALLGDGVAHEPADGSTVTPDPAEGGAS